MDAKKVTGVPLERRTEGHCGPMPRGLRLAYGVFFLYLTAQISIPLPWTPVPITGQTFGVACAAWALGSLAAPTVALYWLLGLCGMPVLAGASSGVLWGPKSGYLLGMLVAADCLRRLKERFFVRSNTLRTWWGILAILAGAEVILFACGLLVLSFFVPRKNLLMAGLWPFLPGEVLKTLAAATFIHHRERYARAGE